MWEFVDKVIYINLDHRTDRKDIMAKFFENAKIPLEKVIRFSAINNIRGKLGCVSSHMEVIKLAKHNGWKNTLILEDDLEIFHFEEGYKQLEELVNLSKWDVIMLCGWYQKFDFPRIYAASNSGAYLVNENYIDKLLSNRIVSVNSLRKATGFNFNTCRFNSDVAWLPLQKVDIWYGLSPCLCRQVDGFSDISKKVIMASKVVGEWSSEIKTQVYG